MNENENYFSVIPSRVLLDNKLTPVARLLYGKLASLTNRDGYCWASNRYLGECFNLKERATSMAISALEKRGYIKIELLEKTKRKIYLVDNLLPTLAKKCYPPSKKMLPPQQKNANNYNKLTNINNYNDKIISEDDRKKARKTIADIKSRLPLKAV